MDSDCNIPIIKVQFPNNPLNSFDIPKFRGAIAKQFPNYYLIHNHLTDGKFRYGYPLIQFKTIDSIPTIIGLAEGIEILKKVFMEIEQLDIEGNRRKIWEKNICMREEHIGLSPEFKNYRFLAPWMALKEENFETYKTLDPADQQQFLRHLLRENLKTLSKGAGYWIPEVEAIKVEGFFKRGERNFKNNRMVCFTGEFMVNFHIPEYLGIGKQVARGFGTVERIK
jgi:hypothetical protein